MKHFHDSDVLTYNNTYMREVSIMARDSENLKRMIVKLSEVGVKITKTKSRLEILESVKESHQISGT